MAKPHLVLSNYNKITYALGMNWGEQSRSRPEFFLFNKTHGKNYQGPKIYHVLDAGMSAFWICSGKKKRSESCFLILSDRSFSDWNRKTNIGSAYFFNGVALDSQYGTTLTHPRHIQEDLFKQKQSGPDQFMEESTPELRDFFVKNILFNIGV